MARDPRRTRTRPEPDPRLCPRLDLLLDLRNDPIAWHLHPPHTYRLWLGCLVLLMLRVSQLSLRVSGFLVDASPLYSFSLPTALVISLAFHCVFLLV